MAGGRLIRNPVLPGFHPDPSILRVGADYYVATSTFEWYPGVRLHHSTDLVHWRPLGGILTEKRLLDLYGAGDSCGVWAPDLSYVDGLFHLVYSDVASFASGYWDPMNYLVTAEDPTGPWSDPIPLHGRGFDASLFHDGDESWLLTMTADWRPGHERFAGINLQRYDRKTQTLVGPEKVIFYGTPAGVTEGPHLHKRDGWYYLVTAEGGTSWEHRVTVARSRSLDGPYEVDPAGSMITSYGRPDLPLQKAGHGSLVETPDGEWYLAYLVGRPYSPLGPCVLGRETALQRVDWPVDGWPSVDGGLPSLTTPAPAGASESGAAQGPGGAVPHLEPPNPEYDDFDGDALGVNWSTLRRPATPDWADLGARKGFLRVHGGQSPVGRQRPSLVARRVTDRHCALEAVMEFRPANYRQLAGVTAYYNTRNWHFAYLTADDDGLPVLEVLTSDSGKHVPHPTCRIPVPGIERVALRAEFDGPIVRFSYALDGPESWREFPVELDATILSDEYAARVVDGEPEAWGFTGAFIGLWVQDLGVDGGYADFDSATYTTGAEANRRSRWTEAEGERTLLQ
ncbi:xylan 1,4-beta-xylosidase [Virgisporangium aliadipatigenens]|uniref:Xylan 1,4-beta-xylosidase n=1 Tax=Virgisporangium aliadipatigenens TaxID=741659 RepID=A0A8J3YH25_9ACTN|nr:glycoside hydrolase family 43 protein [Virgisporangium aliadipatigenens]GIJ45079.1 xylan 1,4-beta-xylosidase [Virgisporangium aliadipatigenens]